MVFLLSVIGLCKPRHAAYLLRITLKECQMQSATPKLFFRPLTGASIGLCAKEEQVSALCNGVWLKDLALKGCNGSGRLERPVGPRSLIRTLCQTPIRTLILCTVMDTALKHEHILSLNTCIRCLGTDN